MLIKATRQYETLEETPEPYSKFTYYDLHPEMKKGHSRKTLPKTQVTRDIVFETLTLHPVSTVDEICDYCGLGRHQVLDAVRFMEGKTIDRLNSRRRTLGTQYKIKETK